VLTGPIKHYYASGRVHYHERQEDQPSSLSDGVYPIYDDDADNTLVTESVIEGGKLVAVRDYGADKLTEEIHYKGDFIDYADIYYNSGRVSTRIRVTTDNPEDVHNAVAEQLLTIYNVEVTNYYDNASHNRESSGRLQHGDKVGPWH